MRHRAAVPIVTLSIVRDRLPEAAVLLRAGTRARADARTAARRSIREFGASMTTGWRCVHRHRGRSPSSGEFGDPRITLGIDKDVYLEHVPIPVDRLLLEHGRERFEILCAACHGITGDSESVVAGNMDLRKPPSLHEDRIRAFPAGRLYRVIRVGYGLMPSYAAQLSVDERWGVVAYVQRAAVQSQRTRSLVALTAKAAR